MPRRLALLVATYRYQDEELQQLTAPGQDAEELADVLGDPEIAGFDVTIKLNEPHHVVGQAIGEFYHQRRRDDLTLLYFTGHGLKDDQGRLYMAMTDTRHDQLLFTGLSASQVNEAMESSASRQNLLILDCCYSGAFPAGSTPKGDAQVHSLQRFEGRGRAVLTASDAIQYSFEGSKVSGDGSRSVFTRFLVEGLTSGEADLDGDGNIALDELYSYVHDHVIAAEPRQKPKILEDVEGRIVIAQNVHWTLPEHLRHSVESPFMEQRLAALPGLRHLHEVGNERVQAEVIRLTRGLVEDDSRKVSAAATTLLDLLDPEGAKERARQEAEAEQARREAEQAERARHEAEEQARREAEERARREAEERARREAEEAERARREAEEAARRREADEQARREAEAEAARAAAEAQARRLAEEEQARQAAAEEQARRAAAEQEARRAAAEEHFRRVAAEEQARRAAGEHERARREAEAAPARQATRTDDRSATSRWVAVGLLVIAVLILIASASSMLDTLRQIRPLQPDGDAWLTVVWLLPAVPAIIAAAVLSVSRVSGVAVGCVVLAGLLVGLSTLFAWQLADEGRAVHLALLAILAAASIAAVIATPAIREPAGVNRPGVLLAALGFVTVAVVVGSVAAATIGGNQQAAVDRPTFWQNLLVPIIAALPGAVIRGNPTQARAMLTLAIGSASYLLLLQATRLQNFTGDSRYEVAYFVSSVCMVIAVIIGQVRHLRRS
ncbi:MAG TPA: caspase family protein [Nocardioidaceae bacterium]|nr:caspase family protein [Nocardioidaceae bacterium]